MCGRFANSETIPVMRAHFNAGGPDIDWQPSWNVCPTRQIPVLLGDDSSRRIGLMRWGWTPEALNGRLLVNCRGEEAHGKRLFQAALARRRCIAPATGFYEWQPAADKTVRPQPFAFMPPTPGLFGIAGLWESVGGAGAVILMTVPANEVVAPVHDRMPLVIPLAETGRWLTAKVGVSDLLSHAQAMDWRRWPISRVISDVKRDGPVILNPLAP
ncbi:MAG: SOS response-associated peptidase [Planctomycetes bacterium]|nr:SOS response-associated peptidase [Planctomycetota bacterium]